MGKSSPDDGSKSSTAKRKTPRSVSSLTPAQLSRKRQNDREAQRAIRERTKNHIAKLEAEVDEMKTILQQNDQVSHLMRRIEHLEAELSGYREKSGHTSQGSRPISYPQHQVYNGMSGSDSSRGSSYQDGHSYEGTPLPTEYPPGPGYSLHGSMGITDRVAPGWEAGQSAVSPAASSPSSMSHPDDTNGHYITPTSAPTMMDGTGIPTSIPTLKTPDALHHYEHGATSPYNRMAHPALHSTPSFGHPQPWAPTQYHFSSASPYTN